MQLLKDELALSGGECIYDGLKMGYAGMGGMLRDGDKRKDEGKMQIRVPQKAKSQDACNLVEQRGDILETCSWPQLTIGRIMCNSAWTAKCSPSDLKVMQWK